MPNSKLLIKVYNFILDLLFPKHCVGCSKEGEWICKTCFSKIILIQKPTCSGCNRLEAKGKFCSICREKTNLTGLIVAAYYKEGSLKEAIHTFKYDGVFDLANELSLVLKSALEKRNFKTAQFISVPLHRKRQAERGYNQTELLIKKLMVNNNKWQIIKNKLIRHKYTKKTQVQLSGKARRNNIKGCFKWMGSKDELKDKRVILVDDVYTTGSTLEECAKVLRNEANVGEIWGLVLAKA